MIATLGQPFTIQASVVDGNTSLFPQVHIYDSLGSLTATIALSLVAEGYYAANWTPLVSGYYALIATFFTDSGHTIQAQYEKQGEEVLVQPSIITQVWEEPTALHLTPNTMGEAVTLIRGLVQQNFVLDNTSFNGKGLMISGRIRIFATASDANAGSNPLATFLITAAPNTSPNDATVSRYTVVRQ